MQIKEKLLAFFRATKEEAIYIINTVSAKDFKKLLDRLLVNNYKPQNYPVGSVEHNHLSTWYEKHSDADIAKALFNRAKQLNVIRFKHVFNLILKLTDSDEEDIIHCLKLLSKKQIKKFITRKVVFDGNSYSMLAWLNHYRKSYVVEELLKIVLQFSHQDPQFFDDILGNTVLPNNDNSKRANFFLILLDQLTNKDKEKLLYRILVVEYVDFSENENNLTIELMLLIPIDLLIRVLSEYVHVLFLAEFLSYEQFYKLISRCPADQIPGHVFRHALNHQSVASIKFLIDKMLPFVLYEQMLSLSSLGNFEETRFLITRNRTIGKETKTITQRCQLIFSNMTMIAKETIMAQYQFLYFAKEYLNSNHKVLDLEKWIQLFEFHLKEPWVAHNKDQLLALLGRAYLILFHTHQHDQFHLYRATELFLQISRIKHLSSEDNELIGESLAEAAHDTYFFSNTLSYPQNSILQLALIATQDCHATFLRALRHLFNSLQEELGVSERNKEAAKCLLLHYLVKSRNTLMSVDFTKENAEKRMNLKNITLKKRSRVLREMHWHEVTAVMKQFKSYLPPRNIRTDLIISVKKRKFDTFNTPELSGKEKFIFSLSKFKFQFEMSTPYSQQQHDLLQGMHDLVLQELNTTSNPNESLWAQFFKPKNEYRFLLKQLQSAMEKVKCQFMHVSETVGTLRFARSTST